MKEPTRRPRTALQRVEKTAITAPLDNVAAFVQAFLASHSAITTRHYTEDLERFRVFVGAPSAESAVRALFEAGQGRANQVVLTFRTALAQNKSPATVNRALSTLRSMVKLARILGHVGWTLEVPNVKSQRYRDTRGPGKEAVDAVVALLKGMDTDDAARDLAIVQLLFLHGLRRGEVVSLDCEHYDSVRGLLWIMGKKRTEREAITLVKSTRGALDAWLALHPRDAEFKPPLFVSLSNAHLGSRLTGEGLRLLVKKRAEQAGVQVPMRPHGVRHTAITEVLDRSHGDLRKARKFSRHKDYNTLERYDDSRQDFAKEMADLLDDKEGRR